MEEGIAVPDRTTRTELAEAARAVINTCVKGPDILASYIDRIGEWIP